MTQRSLLAALLAVAFGPSAFGQSPAEQLDRRNRDQPEIVAETGGRYGACDALLFDRDGRFLFAGGDDKVVRFWPYSQAGLDTTHDPATPRVLRWRAWREQRGGIKAVAVSPDGKRVVVGGYGLKPSTVAVLDRETGDTLALTWPQGRPGIDRFGEVAAVAFDAEGKRVAFGTVDGSVWVWEPRKLEKPDAAGRPASLPRWAGRHDPMMEPNGKPADYNRPRLVYFADRTRLVSVAHSGQVMTCDVGGVLPEVPADRSPGKELFHVNPKQTVGERVFRAEVTPDGKRLVLALVGPQVVLWPTDGKETVRLALKIDHFPRSIAVDPKSGRLAVGVGAALPVGDGPRFYADGHDAIWLYDDPSKGGEPTRVIAHRGLAEALAFHPGDGRLAVAGGDADEVTLLDLATPEKPVSVVRGAGRRPWAVNLSESGNVLGVQTARDATTTDPNRRGAGPWTRFDIPRLTPTADQTQKWLDPVTEADGWKIVPDRGSRFVWHAVKGDVDLRLGTNPNSDNAPTCFTFLPAGGDRPTRVIVGHTYGCSLFELLPAKADNGVLRPARVFTGHAGDVLSVVAAKDQSWFVTGGSDQTVAAWSLVDWPSEPGLGASFAVKDGRVVVTRVDVASPAWEAGLMEGDTLDLVAVGGPRVPQYDRRPAGDREEHEKAWGNPGTPEGAVALLSKPRPRVEISFSVAPTANGPRRTSLTTVRQRPLWKWFPAFDDRDRMTDWVIWMWHGSYYHTQSTHGDDLVGWHVNAPDPGGRPRFHKLRQYEPIFHRRGVIELLVKSRRAADALVDAAGKNPQPLKFSAIETEPVRLELPTTVVGKDGLPLNVVVRPRGTNPDLLPERVELWVNDHRYKVWPDRDEKPIGRQAFERALTIPPGLFRGGENQIAVLTFNPAGGRAEEFRKANNERPAGESNLLGLSVGVNNYAANRQAVAKLAVKREGFKDLGSARKDAQALSDRLLSFLGPQRFFRGGHIDVRLDADASRKRLLGSLDTIAEEAKPDDLLIVFFAGHGDLLMPEAPRKGGPDGARGVVGGQGVFLFCCPDYSPVRPKDTALSADELFDALARVKCRKVVLLDACHAGGATDANVIRRFIPNGQGPFVMAACDRREQSYEHPKFGHGLFTYAVLDALGADFGRADRNRDGQLSAQELYNYVVTRMPVLEEEIGQTPYSQNPICFPRQPPAFAVVKQ